MENNPKKSKAFIITFILILLLLIAGYYLFSNRNTIFDTKGSTTLSKVFAPLLGTSKNKDLTVITNPNIKVPTTSSITGVIITDQNGNKIVRGEAGEDLKKGDVLYISGFNKNKDPIVMKAIASDRTKSLVFGVAGEDMLKGAMGNVIIEGILTGVPTNKKEITLWAVNNPLYLSDKTYGGMTKNAPFAPSFIVPVGSVLKIDAVNGSIRIGGIIAPVTNINIGGNANGIGANGFNTNINTTVLSNLKDFNSQLLGNSGADLQGYFSSVFGANNFNTTATTPTGNNNGFNLNPIALPNGGDFTGGTFTGTNFTGTSTTGSGTGTGSGNTTNTSDTNLNTAPSACKIIEANPLTYTPTEQAELDELLRKFYLLASTLKTDSDLTLAYREIEEYKALVSQVKYITQQCYDQINDPNYTGPKLQFGNPWFKYDKRGSYLPTGTVMESSCKYCEPNIKNGLYCGNLTQTKDQTIPFCEPDGKEVRASGNYSRYKNQFGIPAFGKPEHVINTGNPMDGWGKALLTMINPAAGIMSIIWPAHYINTGPLIQYTNLQDFENILNVW